MDSKIVNTEPVCMICGAETDKLARNPGYKKTCSDKCLEKYKSKIARQNSKNSSWRFTYKGGNAAKRERDAKRS